MRIRTANQDLIKVLTNLTVPQRTKKKYGIEEYTRSGFPDRRGQKSALEAADGLQ